MIDTFFDRTYNEEFNKIPLAFRFSSGTKKIFLGLIAIWVVIDIFLGSINTNNYGLTKVMDGRGLAIRTDFSSWTVFIIANCILVLILTWAVIGTAFERIAFKRASKLDRLHKDWESERLAKQVMRQAARHSANCAVPRWNKLNTGNEKEAVTTASFHLL